MCAAGLEYSLTEKVSLALSLTGYDMINEGYDSPDVMTSPFTQLGLGQYIGIPAVDIDMKYTKFGISVIYG